MAAITNTFQSYQAIGIEEDVSDTIYNITPTKTPFMSNAGRGKTTQRLFEWQTDVLAAAATDNQHIEGDDITSFDAVTPTVRLGNYTQISRKTVIIAGSEQAMKKYGRKDEMGYQLAKSTAELKRDMESSLLANQAAAAGSATTARVTGALPAFVRTNVTYAAGGGNPASYTIPTHARTDGTTPVTFTETMLKAVLVECFNNGAEVDGMTLMVAPAVKQTVSGFAGIATQTYYQTQKVKSAIIGAADVYVSDFGTLTVVPNRFQRSIDAWLLDFNFISLDYLRAFESEPLAKTGDAEKRLMLAEYGLRVNNEAALGLIADIKA